MATPTCTRTKSPTLASGIEDTAKFLRWVVDGSSLKKKHSKKIKKKTKANDNIFPGINTRYWKLIMGDEGLGVHVANQLKVEMEPGLADIVDGGTAGFQLMEYLESYPQVIMIDATLDGKPAGTIRLIKPKFSKDFPSEMSTHEIGLKDLVEGLALLGRLPNIDLFVVSIEKIQPLSTEFIT